MEKTTPASTTLMNNLKPLASKATAMTSTHARSHTFAMKGSFLENGATWKGRWELLMPPEMVGRFMWRCADRCLNCRKPLRSRTTPAVCRCTQEEQQALHSLEKAHDCRIAVQRSEGKIKSITVVSTNKGKTALEGTLAAMARELADTKARQAKVQQRRREQQQQRREQQQQQQLMQEQQARRRLRHQTMGDVARWPEEWPGLEEAARKPPTTARKDSVSGSVISTVSEPFQVDGVSFCQAGCSGCQLCSDL